MAPAWAYVKASAAQDRITGEELWNNIVANRNAGPNTTQQQLIGGFAVNDNQSALHLTAPTKWTGSWFKRPFYYYKQDPGATSIRSPDTVPLVRLPEDSMAGTTFQEIDPEYSLYTYKPTNQPLGDAYVFTGTQIVTNLFIPLEALRKRVAGTKTERLELYRLDWLTYLAHQNQTPANTIGLSFTLNETTHSGRHLDVRGTTGAQADAVKFISTLLAPTNNDKPGSDHADLANFIFRRWCKLAWAASLPAKSKWSVKARFWSIPKSLDEQITFVYDMRSTFYADIGAGIHYLRGNNATFNGDQFTTLWKAAIKKAHGLAMYKADEVDDNAMAMETKAPSPKLKFADEIAQNDRDTLVELGSHPEGFYVVLVSPGDLQKMKTAGYVFDQTGTIRPYPAQSSGPNGRLSQTIEGMVTPLVLAKDTAITTSEISATSVKTAQDWPRCRTQGSIMGGALALSANTVAEKLWNLQNARNVAEWLHRSAYSFGGINGHNPDSSQVRENLVFGTYEANTEMIRYEEYVKRLVQNPFYHGLKVTLQTALRSNVGRENSDLAWLAGGLAWRWSYHPFAANNPAHVARTHVFNLFSRRYPTRFEVEVDENFDYEWMGLNKTDFQEALVASIIAH